MASDSTSSEPGDVEPDTRTEVPTPDTGREVPMPNRHHGTASERPGKHGDSGEATPDAPGGRAEPDPDTTEPPAPVADPDPEDPSVAS